MAQEQQAPTANGSVLPLPKMPESQQGTSTASSRHYKASVSNAAGYLCHIHVDCTFDVPPEVIFEVFCHPDNAGAFRDIKKVGYRKVTASSPGLKCVEVEQCGELRVMWVCRTFKTYLDVTEDSRDPECLKTDFKLLRSDILSRFHGAWELRPQRDASGAVVGCHAVLTQDVLPHGVPSFFARLPVLGGLLRQVSLNTIRRLMDDISHIVTQYKAGGGKLSVSEVLANIAAERGHVTDPHEDRAERLSDGDDAFKGGNGSGSGRAGSGGKQQRGKGGKGGGTSSSNNSSSKASNVTSFAVDEFSESEELSEDPGQTHGQQQHDGGGGGGSDGASTGSATAGVGAGGQGALAGAGVAGAVAAASAGGGGSVPAGEQQQAGAAPGEVGVVLDVTQHGHVHVVLVPKQDLM